ncbi:MAG: methionine synthase [Bacteroidales bacterium]|nr:methionine synthase [Bacteroidales bacterium]MDD5046833.1 methionine synthase [Bacteroidales bacterium]MDD5516971.1 methionine synthase [Bacteroidales bacterium]MDY0353383.1 methionine synthase [Bacteroidales bacterium]
MNWQNSKPGILLQGRILILDGAMGTMIQRLGPSFPPGNEGNNDMLVLTRPELILSIHKDYVKAGADIVTTNTFNANRISQLDYGMQDQVYKINYEAARLAHESGAMLIAGSMGPTNKSASISPDVNQPGFRAVDFNTLVEAYREQARGLKDGGVDLFLVETVFDTLNAKAALFALSEEAPGIPVILSATIGDNSGRVLSGQTIEAFLVSTAHAGLFGVGLNCSFGPDKMLPYMRTLSRYALTFTSAHPNAGLPDLYGNYNLTPEKMIHQVKPYIDEGLVNIIGGCCGTTPSHIAALAAMVHQSKAPVRNPGSTGDAMPSRSVILSGLEVLTVQEEPAFLVVGERTNVSGSRRFARLINEKKYDEALEIARGMVQDGAHILDVNMDDPMLDAPVAMREFLLRLGSDPEVARVPLMLDSSCWEVLEAGLQCIQGKSIVNSISLKEGPAEFLRRAGLIKKYGAAALVMAFDEQGQATTFERRVEICTRAYHMLVEEAGFEPRDIILDPNVLAVGTGMEEHRHFAADFLETVRYLKKNLPGAVITAGVSNLSFSFRGNETVREAMHSVFLYHAIAAGLDMAIVKPGAQPIYSDIPEPLRHAVEDVILDSDAGATLRLVEIAATTSGKGQTLSEDSAGQAWREMEVRERLMYALLHGIEKYLQEDLEALSGVPAIKIVESTLMEGMTRVGKLFGEGKMFLPQVVRTARTMKKAVAILQPRIEAEKNNGPEGKTTEMIHGIMATVKGDVHDIGKNLVSLVMECNNYRVTDLGVMVPAHRIVEAAIENEAAFVGLSGLITPSLDEMTEVAKSMEKAGLTIPLLIGGATTSALFTALRIAPGYSGPVIHCPDAAGIVPLLADCFSCESRVREGFRTELGASQARLREVARRSAFRAEYLSLEEARTNKWVSTVNWRMRSLCPHCGQRHGLDDFVPPFVGVRDYKIPFEVLRPYAEWDTFLRTWEIRENREQAEIIMKDAGKMLDDLIGDHFGNIAFARAVTGFWPVFSTPDDHLVFFTDASCRNTLLDMPMERDLMRYKDGSPNMCLTDFIVQKGPAHTPDYAGLFLLTASSPELESLAEHLRDQQDVYGSLILKSLLDMFAEACSQYLHHELMRLPCGALRGIRPAFGYPSCPGHGLKKGVTAILQKEYDLGVTLTSSYMLQPAASLCGMYIGHPQARYFTVHKIPGV